ncbi:MAG: M14 family metallopeptidase, partial [Gemmatimonadota bacterium]
YQAGRDVIRAYTEQPPYAYFIPQEQHDPVAAVELLRRLAFNGVEVYQLDREIDVDGMRHPAGTWAIPMDQEFAHFVRQLFEVQEYPDLREFPEGPPEQPYDVAGWTVPYQMEVRVYEAASPLDAEARAAMSPVRGEALPWDAEVEDAAPFDSPPGVGFDSHPVAAGIVPPAGRVTGGGPALLLDAAQNNAFRALNRAWEAGAEVRFIPGVRGEEGEPGTSGRWAVIGLSGSAQDAIVRDLALRAERGSASGGQEVRRPRVGLYRPWSASIDEGWTRWLLERYRFAFRSVRDAEIRAGALRERYDVLVLADMSPGQIVEGFRDGSVPPRYAGGIGEEGVRALDAFVRAGGTLVCLNRSIELATERLHLPVRNVVDGLDREEFFQSGSIVEMIVDPSHPVMTGMPARAKIVVERGPVLATDEGFEGRILAKYPADGSPLLSGYLLGEEHLQGYAAAVEAQHGEGRVLLLGMRPQWRAQPFGNFRILFNAALYTREVAEAAPDGPAFWRSPEATAEEATAEDDTGEGRADPRG